MTSDDKNLQLFISEVLGSAVKELEKLQIKSLTLERVGVLDIPEENILEFNSLTSKNSLICVGGYMFDSLRPKGLSFSFEVKHPNSDSVFYTIQSDIFNNELSLYKDEDYNNKTTYLTTLNDENHRLFRCVESVIKEIKQKIDERNEQKAKQELDCLVASFINSAKSHKLEK